MPKKIFISHASKDEPIIKAFVEDILNLGLSVKTSEIFCTTTDGTKIESGLDWRNSIKDTLINTKVTILIITPHYKESEICQNEMGASWVLSGKVLPLIVEPINYKNVGVLQEVKQVEKLTDEKSLDCLKDVIQSELEIPASEIKSDRWTVKKKEFLMTVSTHLEQNPFPLPLHRDIFEQMGKEKNEFETTCKSLLEEKTELKKLVEDLKKAKDKQEVEEIEKQHGLVDEFDEFKKMCAEVHNNFKGIHPIIIGMIFADFTRQDLSFDVSNCRPACSDAIAKGYIDEDLNVKTGTPKIEEIFSSLSELGKFMENCSYDFLKKYKSEYTAPCEINNSDFWETVLRLSVCFE